MTVNPARIRPLNERPQAPGPVIYWMSRDQRIEDNWALLYAAEMALNREEPVVILFCLTPSFPGASARSYDFMLKGLMELEPEARKRNIGFVVLAGEPSTVIPALSAQIGAGLVVKDFSPLTVSKEWRRLVAEILTVPLIEVDAHNIVPCRIVSPKQEYSARTIRPKINALLHEFLEPFPVLKSHPYHFTSGQAGVTWDALKNTLRPGNVPVMNTVVEQKPGRNAAFNALESFIEYRLGHYAAQKNDPSVEALSGLSPYLHFGQLSCQRVALAVAEKESESVPVFLEELIVRRELAENFCLYNEQYYTFDGLPKWAKNTLIQHWEDPRPFLYSREEFERGLTHDALWNAAQMEMVTTGKMHGYMRMYWAKKILEWSRNPEEAMHIAIFLNDTYSLDGRDPNGYTGIAWSIGGLHDRPWFPRPVFGTIRYMSYEGCRKKFDIRKYISKFPVPGFQFPVNHSNN